MLNITVNKVLNLHHSNVNTLSNYSVYNRAQYVLEIDDEATEFSLSNNASYYDLCQTIRHIAATNGNDISAADIYKNLTTSEALETSAYTDALKIEYSSIENELCCTFDNATAVKVSFTNNNTLITLAESLAIHYARNVLKSEPNALMTAHFVQLLRNKFLLTASDICMERSGFSYVRTDSESGNVYALFDIYVHHRKEPYTFAVDVDIAVNTRTFFPYDLTDSSNLPILFTFKNALGVITPINAANDTPLFETFMKIAHKSGVHGLVLPTA